MGPPASPQGHPEPPQGHPWDPQLPSVQPNPRHPPGFGAPGTPHSRCSCGTRFWPCRVWAPRRSRGPAGGHHGMGTGTRDRGQGQEWLRGPVLLLWDRDPRLGTGGHRHRGGITPWQGVSLCHTVSHGVTHSVTLCHTQSRNVTPCHTQSHISITRCHTVSQVTTRCPQPAPGLSPGSAVPHSWGGPTQVVPVGDSLRVPAQPQGAVGPPRAGPDPPTPPQDGEQLPMASGPPCPLQGVAGRTWPRGLRCPPGLGWPGCGCPPPGECPEPPRPHSPPGGRSWWLWGSGAAAGPPGFMAGVARGTRPTPRGQSVTS